MGSGGGIGRACLTVCFLDTVRKREGISSFVNGSGRGVYPAFVVFIECTRERDKGKGRHLVAFVFRMFCYWLAR